MEPSQRPRRRPVHPLLLLALLFLLTLISTAPAFVLFRPFITPHRHHAGPLALSSTPEQEPAFRVTRSKSQHGQGRTLTVALADGRTFTLLDRCPPTNHSLLAARVDPAVLALQDPVFGTRFDLRTGRVRGAWCPDGPGWVRATFPPAGLTVLEPVG